MISVYALIIIFNLASILNYFLFRSFYGYEFNVRYQSVLEGIKNKMIQANNEMEEKIGEKIKKGEEPEDLIKFGEIWRNRLNTLKNLDKEREKMKGHIKFVYFLLVFSLIFSILDITYGAFITDILGRKLSFNTIGWLLTLTACFFIFLHQNFYRKIMMNLNESELELIDSTLETTEDEAVKVYQILTKPT